MVSGTDKRQRGKIIPVRCTAGEHAEIHGRAGGKGLTAGAFLRAAALGEAGPRAKRRPPADQQELRRLMGELARVGNNINQIARNLNRERQVEVPELRAAMRAYLELRTAILSALGHTATKDAHDYQGRQPKRS